MSPNERFRLDDRVALIAGGGGAIGAAIGAAFADAGAKVVLMGHSKENTEAAAAQIGSAALAVVADATSEAECEAAVAQAVSRFGRLDIVVNAVGGGAGKVLHNAEEYPRDDWDWIFELNLRSTVVTTQAAVKQMIAADQGGKVLNLVSVQQLIAAVS